MAAAVESWDDDDFAQGDFGGAFAGASSVNTAHGSLSSRMSVLSESVIGDDDDWNVPLVLNGDEHSTTQQAIQSAKQAGIPLPAGIPASALLGGTIKRLGKKTGKEKVKVNDDDWDLEMPDSGTGGLQLKPKLLKPDADEDFDDFDELEGSLGIRFAGTKRDARGSSASAMSPSLGSVTAESEEDELRGLDIPEGPMDFEAILRKRRAAEAELSDLSQHPSPAIEQPATLNVHKKHKVLSEDNDDFLNDFDLGGGETLDFKKRTINKNLKVKNARPTAPVSKPATTLNFHDKPTDKPVYTRSHLPRPVSGSKPPPSRLASVPESHSDASTSHVPYQQQPRKPTTNTAQLLRSKRSMPTLRGQSAIPPPVQSRPAVPFMPSQYSQPTSSSNNARAMPYHLRRDSDLGGHHGRPGASSPPPMRPQSRLSQAYHPPDTPSRNPTRGTNQHSHQLRSKDLAPSALVREAAAKRTITKPSGRRRNFGDGSELEIFDDLPTSTAKGSQFVKEPVARGPPKLASGLRHKGSKSDVRGMMTDPMKRGMLTSIPDRMMTPAPAPRTPASPTKGFGDAHGGSNTPSYLRDTAASRIARESRRSGIGGPNTTSGTSANSGIGGGAGSRPRSEGPLMPLSTNWKAQIAARSPHTSPSTLRSGISSKRAQPTLIKQLGGNVAKAEKGMLYNPHTLRWEGNENTLHSFETPTMQTPTPDERRHEPSSYMDNHHPTLQRHFAPVAPVASPPRPALIAPMSAGGLQGVQVNGGMVFDPRQMKWLKLKPHNRDFSGPRSPSITDGGMDDEDEDAFAGIEDLPDENAAGGLGGGMQSPVSLVLADGTKAAAGGGGEVHEEFDLGPQFIRIQREEEAEWRRRVGGWFPESEGRLTMRGEEVGRGWEWAIRGIV